MQARLNQSADSRLLAEVEPQQPADETATVLRLPPIPGGPSQKVTVQKTEEPDRVSGLNRISKEHAALAQAHGDFDLAIYEELSRVNQELFRLQRELAGKNAELKRLRGELQAAQAEVKTLQGFLPICTSCKKIRDDQGYWNQIEQYFHAHTGVGFTHSICPDCLKNLYPDLYPKK